MEDSEAIAKKAFRYIMSIITNRFGGVAYKSTRKHCSLLPIAGIE